MISTKVITDSLSPEGKRLTTFVLEYPRFVHAEFMTHRVFSRNASSSRAIPVAKQIARIKEDPAMPIHWGKNQAGMQANEELGETPKAICQGLWLAARDQAVVFAEELMRIGLHKQVANRILEPWMHIGVVLTATEWGNWFNLRYHPMAQPEIQELARVMWEAMQASTPDQLGYGQWHLPFLSEEDKQRIHHRVVAGEPHLLNHVPVFQAKISAARCARVSYLNHEGKTPTLDEDLALYERLMGGNPKHASPTEHQARPMESFGDLDLGGNFQGWVQFRKLIGGENQPIFKGPTI